MCKQQALYPLSHLPQLLQILSYLVFIMCQALVLILGTQDK